MRLRRKQSQITTLPESRPPKHRPFVRLSALLYYCVILGLVGYLLYYLTMTYLMVEARGRMFIAKHQLYPPVAGILSDISIQETFAVSKGQTLALVTPEMRPTPSFAQEKARVDRDLQMKREWIALYQSRINEKRRQLGRVVSQSALDAALELRLRTTAPTSGTVRDMDDERLELAKTQAEIRAMENYLEQVNNIEMQQARNTLEALNAPFDGTITGVFKREFGYTDRDEPFCSVIRKGERGKIVAYFEPEDAESVVKGKDVTVVLPDNSKIQAKIQAFYSASLDSEVTVKEKYVPVVTSLAVDVVPDEPLSETIWRAYDETDVKVLMRR